jgi:hypothetical protein
MLMPILPPLVLLLVIEYFATDLLEIWGLLVFVLMPFDARRVCRQHIGNQCGLSESLR